jgi:osmoprotectant transport system ATP-binding protein
MIKAINLVRSYNDVTAVNDISFEVEAGENFVLLGTSGCGKTTTLRMINRLEEPDSGNILINGVDIRKEQPEQLRRGIGYVLQNHGLFPHYNVEENVSIVPRLLGWDIKRIRKRAAVLFEKLHLEKDIAAKYPNVLSGGQQQRVGLARSLMVDPAILLMDEPFGALDNVTRSGIRKEFKTLDELVQKTIVMVTHDVQEAFELGDRICIMDKGKIMQVGSPLELLFRPANDFVRSFLDEQRLQLELKAVSMTDLVSKGYANDQEPGQLNVWDYMERLLHVADGDSASNKTTSLGELLQAFQNFKIGL